MFFSPENNDDKEFFNETTLPEETQNQEKQVSIEEESYREKFLRLSADFTNFKKRTEKERADWMIAAQSHVLEELLPLFDELDRAIELSEKENTMWLEGFKLIQKNWKKKLAELGVEEIESIGVFNPEKHEALMQVEQTDKQSGEIVQIFSKGYSFKGKVIRHAKVSVAQ